MKNKLIIFGLLIIIVATFGFIGLKLSAAGPDDNYFNQHLRSDFASHPFLRQILGLHYDGDAVVDYLGSRYDGIAISVAVEAGITLAPNVLQDFADKITQVTGKKTSYSVSPALIPTTDVASKSPVELESSFRKLHSSGRTAALYVLLLGTDPEDSKLLGSTLQEDAIVLYIGALKDFASRFPKTLPNYEFSTLLHEFGHQLGLPHNDLDNCLMNERAEHAESFIELPSDVIVDFCPQEYSELQTIKSYYNR
ncbi:MAG: hypothetical protein M1275_01310 [Patescibacteria group bacterium]|nr:hypothetical protein [Patescibacteria group bacterium]